MTNGHVDKSFEDRARYFLTDLARGKGFIMLYREFGHDVTGLKVGIGRHTGLVFKEGDVSHAQKASEFYDRLVGHFKERGYKPYSYELAKPNFVAAGERVGVVQDYFKEPSLTELMGYLGMGKEIKKIERKLQRGLNAGEMETFRGRFVRDEDSGLRCNQFLNEPHNKGISLEQMTEVEREFTCDNDCLDLSVKSDNVIVLGQRRSKDLQKIGLAIIDD